MAIRKLMSLQFLSHGEGMTGKGSMRSKSWLEKLHDSKDLPRIVVLDKQTKSASVETCVIPAPLEVDEVMRKVPEGRLITINDIRAILARKHGTTFGDLTATSIFSNIAALAAVEAAEAGHDDITPYWRTVQENGALREKYPGGAEGQKALLEKEGHTVAQKGRRLVVQDFETKRFRL